MTHRCFTLFVLLSAFVTLHADMPRAEEKPAISLYDALVLAEKHIRNKLPDPAEYYPYEAICGYRVNETRRSWVFGFARAGQGTYFIAVYMDGSVIGGVNKDAELASLIAKRPEGRAEEAEHKWTGHTTQQRSP